MKRNGEAEFLKKLSKLKPTQLKVLRLFLHGTGIEKSDLEKVAEELSSQILEETGKSKIHNECGIRRHLSDIAELMDLRDEGRGIRDPILDEFSKYKKEWFSPEMAKIARERIGTVITPPLLGTPIELESEFYIKNSEIFDYSIKAIQNPNGGFLRIRSPRFTGRTSFLLRLLNHASQNLGYQVVNIQLETIDRSILSSLDNFSLWLCEELSDSLGIPRKIDDYWGAHSMSSCTKYIERYLLSNTSSPVVLAFDRLESLFDKDFSEVRQSFIPFLRIWFNNTASERVWQKLRLVLCYASDELKPDDELCSPFNVGLEIGPFSLSESEILELTQRYGIIGFSKKSCKELVHIFNGHPYLTHTAIQKIWSEDLEPRDLLQEARSPQIFRGHLNRLYKCLTEFEGLLDYFRIILRKNDVYKDQKKITILEGLGLIYCDFDNQPNVSCELYRLYFLNVLGLN